MTYLDLGAYEPVTQHVSIEDKLANVAYHDKIVSLK